MYLLTYCMYGMFHSGVLEHSTTFLLLPLPQNVISTKGLFSPVSNWNSAVRIYVTRMRPELLNRFPWNLAEGEVMGQGEINF